jgi:DNA-binding phage protein
MSKPIINPRSALHALSPIGTGTPEVESLLSYLCRLAVSHSVSLASLSRRIAQSVGWDFSEKYDAHFANINGIGEAAMNWSSALSALTSVERLDRLTLLPWQNVVAQSCLAASSSRWCPECLTEDRSSGKAPYFRLAWDVGAVDVCQKHKIALVHACPDCGRTDSRHKSAYVVPGWCAHCGAFLGDVSYRTSATPEQMWKASQIGALFAAQATLDSMPTRDALHETLRMLVTRLDHGKSAVFARRIGLSKTTVHHWLKNGGAPTMPALLRIASQTGLALTQLLTGNLIEWPPASLDIYQLSLLFPEESQRPPARIHDWNAVRKKLAAISQTPEIISLTEAARQLDIDPKLLYLHANQEARFLSERWKQYMQRKGEQSMKNARSMIENACEQILADGRAPNLRKLYGLVPSEVLGSIRGTINLLQEIKERPRMQPPLPQ